MRRIGVASGGHADVGGPEPLTPRPQQHRQFTPCLAHKMHSLRQRPEYTGPHSFAYELTEFTGVLGRLVTSVRGEWMFTPDGAGSLIRWTYSFFPRPGSALLVRWGVVPLWRRYAAATLAKATNAVDG